MLQPDLSLPLKIHYEHPSAVTRLAFEIRKAIDSLPVYTTPVILCIGTDRSTGDSLGPLVGTALLSGLQLLKIYGSLEQPVHAVNLEATLKNIYSTVAYPYILAIDACLGQPSSVGHLTFADGPLRPGAGVNKTLPEVGDAHITGVVNVGGFMEYMVLQNTRLNLVVRMADVISNGIRYGIEYSTHNNLGMRKENRMTNTSLP